MIVKHQFAQAVLLQTLTGTYSSAGASMNAFKSPGSLYIGSGPGKNGRF